MDVDQDVWAKFAPIIKRLYQDQRKTLREVKAILEGQHGFPETPLSTYESKLREVYKLRKKFKKSDWPIIDYYTCSHGLDKFDIYLNGTLIPSKTTRKEVRRSRREGATLPVNQPSALPEGIEIRRRSGHVSRQASPLPTPQAPRQPWTPRLPDVVSEAIQPDAPINILTEDLVMSDFMDPGLATPAGAWNPLSPTSWHFHMQLLDSQHQNDTVDATSLVARSPTLTRTATPTTSICTVAPNASPKVSGELMRYRYIFSKVNLETLPWNQYRLELESLRNGGKPVSISFRDVEGWSLALMPADGFFKDIPRGLPVPISETRYPTADDLKDYMSSFEAVSNIFDPFHMLAQVVYAVSNHFRSDYDTIILLDTLVLRVEQRIALLLFQSNASSIRAVWERLFTTVLKVMSLGWRTDAAKKYLGLLVRITTQCHPEWIEKEKHRLLFAAVLLEEESLVQKLLRRGADPWWSLENWHRYRRRGSANVFSVAAEYGSTSCAKHLVEYCRPNTRVQELTVFVVLPRTVFLLFLSDFFQKVQITAKKDDKDDGDNDDMSVDGKPYSIAINKAAYLGILQVLLNAGADVDMGAGVCDPNSSTCGSIDVAAKWYLRCPPYSFRGFCDVAHKWHFSCLDYSFRRSRAMFDHLVPYSRKHMVEVTRSGILMATENGQDALSAYLNSVTPPPGMTTQQCLEVTLEEEFGRDFYEEQRYLDARAARTLVEYGVSINILRGDKIWEIIKAAGGIYPDEEKDGDLHFLLHHFIRAGAPISMETIKRSLEGGDVKLLRLWIQFEGDVADKGGDILLKAVLCENHQAISLLLQEGVDINSQVGEHKDQWTTIFACLLLKYHPPPMTQLRFLVDSGARPRLRPNDRTCYELLRKILQRGLWESWWSYINLLDQPEHGLDQMTDQQWMNLLSAAASPRVDRFPPRPPSNDQVRIMKSLIQRFTARDKRLQSVLPTLIVSRCVPELVMKLVSESRDINAYSEASGDQLYGASMTPLQAAVEALDYDLVSRIVQLGANVNSPAGENGGAALELACQSAQPHEFHHQKRIIKFLVAHGADINARNQETWRTPLQTVFVCKSRRWDRKWPIDEVNKQYRWIVTFLLKHGADVNAPSKPDHMNLLQEVASRGNIDLASILVQHGADVNRHPMFETKYKHSYLERTEWVAISALDKAAGTGRLDMTQYLLNVGALSATPGSSGFQGAIDRASSRGFDSIITVIHEHATKIAQQQRHNATLHKAHQECVQQITAAVLEGRLALEKKSRMKPSWLR